MSTNKLTVAAIVVAVLFTACNKDKKSQNVLNLTAIDDSKSQLVNVKLQKSTEKKTFSIEDCLGSISTIFDVKNKIFGYSYYGGYCLIDVETGTEIKRIPLPKPIGSVVLDTIRNVIIGMCWSDETCDIDPWKLFRHVITINLSDGSVSISDKQFYGITLRSIYFFRDIENEYVLNGYNPNELMFINPTTGDIIRTLSLEASMAEGIYDRKNNRLIGLTYPEDAAISTQRYIVTIDLNTGKTLNKVIAQGLDYYREQEADYDAVTNSFILISNSSNEVMFFDIETGEITQRYQLDFNITSLKVWRSAE